ncbi:MAG: nucleoside 2-deoxyribosyltransferase [Acidobacteriota bacterium]
MNIYFAASIRGGRDDWASYLEIVKQLRAYGEVLTEHVGDVELSAAGEDIGDRMIHDRDLGWLKNSDYLVAEVTTPSLGVGYEIGKATEWGKPVLCLYRPSAGRVLSAMISECNGVTLREYQTTQELRKILKDFFCDHQPRLAANKSQ